MKKLNLLFKILIWSCPLLAILSTEYVKYTLIMIYFVILDRYILNKQESVIGSKLIQEQELNFFNWRKKV